MTATHPGACGSWQNLIAQLFILITIVIIPFWIHNYPGLAGPNGTYLAQKSYDWHGVMMTFCFVLFMFEAVIIWRVLPGSRERRLWVHALLHTASAVTGSIGIYLMFHFHNENQYPNLYSTHSVVGLFGMILFYGQYVFGAIVYLTPVPSMFQMIFTEYHRFFGRLITGWVAGAIALGIFDRQRIYLDDTTSHDRLFFSTWMRISNAAVVFVGFAVISVSFLFSPAAKLSTKEVSSEQQALLTASEQ